MYINEYAIIFWAAIFIFVVVKVLIFHNENEQARKTIKQLELENRYYVDRIKKSKTRI